MNILAGGPARETESAVFKLHEEGLEAQSFAPRAPILSSSSTEEEIGVAARVVTGARVQVQHEVVRDAGGPRWTRQKIARVAQVRQRFMKRCQPWSETLPNALFMVDTDVICGPGVLERLMQVDADVVFGVFFTQASWGGPYGPWPQVWTKNPYGFDPLSAELLTEGLDGIVNEVEVFGGGACTLIRGRGFESRYWPLLDSLQVGHDDTVIREDARGMWAGEDRSYCLGLEARGIRMVAVTGLPIVHLHTERSDEAVARAREEVGLGTV